MRRDLVIAPLCEALLLLIAGTIAWATRQPMLFASLGPTAYELVEGSHRNSARPYNILIGHLIGVLSGFAALALTGAFHAPVVGIGHVPPIRVLACAVCALLTVFFTLLAGASQPAAVASGLLVSLGTMQTPRDGLAIMSAVLCLTLVGEPLRRWRLADIRRHPADREIAS